MDKLTLSKFREFAHMEQDDRIRFCQALRKQVVTYEDIKIIEVTIDNFRLQKLDQEQRNFLRMLMRLNSFLWQRYKLNPDYQNALYQGMTVQEYRRRKKESFWSRLLSVFWKKQKKQEALANQMKSANSAKLQKQSDQLSLEEGLLTNDRLKPTK